MSRIVPGIDSLEQHRGDLAEHPERYRPQRCPHCGKAGVWRHGQYHRNAPRGERQARSRDPIPIARFRCPNCRCTCSRLPSCLAPRRHSLWMLQQAVIEGLIAGESIRQLARRLWPSRRTIGRWRGWLQERLVLHAFHLRSRFAELGRAVEWDAFWSAGLARMKLSEAMAWLDRVGVAVP